MKEIKLKNNKIILKKRPDDDKEQELKVSYYEK